MADRRILACFSTENKPLRCDLRMPPTIKRMRRYWNSLALTSRFDQTIGTLSAFSRSILIFRAAPMVRTVFRLIACVFALYALWLFYQDISSSSPTVMFGQLWFELAPGSLQVSESIISRYIDPCGLIIALGCSPFLWHPVISTLLLWPAAIVISAISLIIFVLSSLGRSYSRRDQQLYRDGRR